MKTRVVNKRKESFTVDISRNSKWGNPFRIGRDGDRKMVVRLHLIWLLTWLRNGKEIIIDGFSNKWVCNNLIELYGETLGCYCKPKACHGDNLIRFVNDKQVV